MVSQYSDFTKLKHAKQEAKDHGCFVVEIPTYDKDGFRNGTKFLLYREAEPKNQLVGKRKSLDGIVTLVKLATGMVKPRLQRKGRPMTEAERLKAQREFDEDERRKRMQEEMSNYATEDDE